MSARRGWMRVDAAHVRDNRRVWERIAQSFHRTRTKPWAVLDEFAADLAPTSTVLDAGCGNGRHVRPLLAAGHRVVGLDLSSQLLRLARAATPQPAAWVEGAIERLPFRDASFDACIAIAVLHHVRGRAHRVATIQGLLQAIRPSARLLVSGWSLDQPRFRTGKELRRPTSGPIEDGDHLVK
jgi:SAM-dependent methyltransferase